jgi:hypothetical protein
MVIELGSELALCVSYETPAGSVPMPEATKLCEPGFVYLKYQRDDRWLQTHYFTYACFNLDEQVKTNESLRVQVPQRTGKFLGWDERIKIMSNKEES